MLEFGITRNAKRPAKGEIAEQAPGRRRVIQLLANRADGDSGDPGGFENMGQRTDSTRAQGSDRCQQHHVYFVVFQQLGAGRGAIEANA